MGGFTAGFLVTIDVVRSKARMSLVAVILKTSTTASGAYQNIKIHQNQIELLFDI